VSRFAACCHCEEPTGRRFAPPEDRLRDEAISAGFGCDGTRLLRGVYPRAGREPDPWARNDARKVGNKGRTVLIRPNQDTIGFRVRSPMPPAGNSQLSYDTAASGFSAFSLATVHLGPASTA
jgi:hypothetical protein